jgi:adenylate cyclase
MLCRRAVALDGADAEAHACLGLILSARGEYKGAQAEAERALTLSPNLARAHHALAHTLIFEGQQEAGLAAVEKCIRLDPQDPAMPFLVNLMEVGRYFSRLSRGGGTSSGMSGVASG